MNSFAKIKKACKNAGLPAYPDYNTNNEDMYVVYNIVSETPDLFGDDEPNAIVASLQAHLYIPADKNFFDIQRRLSNELFRVGFTYPAVVLNTTEEDNTVRHIVLEFQDDIDI